MKRTSPVGLVKRIPVAGGMPLLVESSSDLPLVHFMIGFRTGAELDPEGLEGLTRFTARLLRRTAGGLPSSAIESRIDDLGGAISVDAASTSTTLHGTVIARSLEGFTALLLDMLGKPGFLNEELERLRRETTSELIQARDDDRYLARRAFKRRVFGTDPQGRSTSGTLRSVARFQESDVRNLAGQLLRSKQALVAISGDMSEDRARAFAEEVERSLSTAPAMEIEVPPPAVPKGRRLVFVDKPERSQTQIFIGGLGTHPHDNDHLALQIANTVFGGTFTARLSEEIRVKRGWSYGAYASLPYGRGRQPFSMWTFPKAADAAACIALELELLERWRERGITKKELGAAKRYLDRSQAFAVDTASKRVGLASESVLLELPEGYHEHYVERLRAVTLDEVNGAIRNRIDPENLLISVLGTHPEIGVAIEKAVPRLASAEVVAFDVDE